MLNFIFGPLGGPRKFREVRVDVHFFRVFCLKKAKSSVFHDFKSLYDIYNLKADLQSQDLYLVPQKISERSDE